MPLEWDLQRVRAMVPSVDASPWGPLESAGDVLAGSFLYEFGQGGARALVAVRPVSLAHGRRLDVVGLVSLGDRMRSGELSAAVCEIGRGFGAVQVAMCTKHEHVARQCARHGWEQTGVVMTRAINVEQ